MVHIVVLAFISFDQGAPRKISFKMTWNSPSKKGTQINRHSPLLHLNPLFTCHVKTKLRLFQLKPNLRRLNARARFHHKDFTAAFTRVADVCVFAWQCNFNCALNGSFRLLQFCCDYQVGKFIPLNWIFFQLFVMHYISCWSLQNRNSLNGPIECWFETG